MLIYLQGTKSPIVPTERKIKGIGFSTNQMFLRNKNCIAVKNNSTSK